MANEPNSISSYILKMSSPKLIQFPIYFYFSTYYQQMASFIQHILDIYQIKALLQVLWEP